MNRRILFTPPFRVRITWAPRPTRGILVTQGNVNIHQARGSRHRANIACYSIAGLQPLYQAPTPRASRPSEPISLHIPSITRRDPGGWEDDVSSTGAMTELSKALSQIPFGDSFDIEIENEVLDILKQTLTKADDRPGSTSLVVEAAVETINRWAFKSQADQGDMEFFLWAFWEVLIDVVKAVPADHPAQETLVSVIGSLQKIKPTTVRVWYTDMILWDELPLFGPVAREAWAEPSWDGKSIDDDAVELVPGWVSLNMFIARITAAGIMDFQMYGLGVIMDALELDLTLGPVLDYRLVVASRWILVCGEGIFEDALRGDPLEDWKGWTRPGPLYKGKVGLWMERWWFWLGRFEELQGLVSKDVGTKVQEAIEKMKRMERNDEVIKKRRD